MVFRLLKFPKHSNKIKTKWSSVWTCRPCTDILASCILSLRYQLIHLFLDWQCRYLESKLKILDKESIRTSPYALRYIITLMNMDFFFTDMDYLDFNWKKVESSNQTLLKEIRANRTALQKTGIQIGIEAAVYPRILLMAIKLMSKAVGEKCGSFHWQLVFSEMSQWSLRTGSLNLELNAHFYKRPCLTLAVNYYSLVNWSLYFQSIVNSSECTEHKFGVCFVLLIGLFESGLTPGDCLDKISWQGFRSGLPLLTS